MLRRLRHVLLTADTASVDAHTEHLTLHLVIAYPAHLPRKTDPHYGIFHDTRRRLQKLGALKCWIGNSDCAGGIELHHDKVEFSLANDVDVVKFSEAYGCHLTDDQQFLDYVESESNLLAICVAHHRGAFGIHCMPYPLWIVQKYLKDGIAAPARLEPSVAVSHKEKE